MLVSLFFASTLLISTAAQKSEKPLSKSDVIDLLQGDVPPARVAEVARSHGIAFQVDPATEKDLRDARADDDLIKVLRELAPKPPAEPAAPLAAPPPPTPPVLLIVAMPGGAQVYVDDEPMGKTSPEGRMKLSTLPPRKHTVRLSLDGYLDQEESVELAEGATVDVVRVLAPVKPAAPPPVQGPPAPRPQQAQDWIGRWAFGAPAVANIRCTGGKPSTASVPLAFQIVSVSPSGEVRAQFPTFQFQNSSAKTLFPGSVQTWSGQATPVNVVLAPQPIPAGTRLDKYTRLEAQPGRVELFRQGDSYSITYSYGWSTHTSMMLMHVNCGWDYSYNGPIRRQ